MIHRVTLNDYEHELAMRALDVYVTHWREVYVSTESVNMAAIASAKVQKAQDLGAKLRDA